MAHPPEEAARLAALDRYAILDTEPEGAFDDLARMAASVCGTPVALVTFVDADRQWFKARVGMDWVETPREVSFCAHAIRGCGLFVVPDAASDGRFAANPLVTGGPSIRFYAGSPLIDADGHALGSLCVIDRVPRELTPAQAGGLEVLGRQAVAQLALRKALGDARRAGAAARASEARQTAVLEAAIDAIITVDSGGVVLGFNAAAERTFGYPRGEAIGRHLEDLVTPPGSWQPPWRETGCPPAACRCDAPGGLLEGDATRKGGETFPAEMAVAAIGGDGPRTFVVQVRDVAARRRIEEANRLLAAVVESSDDAIIAKSLDGVITSWNGGAERIFGYTAAEAVGRHVSILIPPERAGEMECVLERVRRGERVDHFETRRRTRDGRTIDVSLSVSPVRDASGRVVGASKVARDVTDRKRAEEALTRSEAEARRLALVASRTDNAVIITDAAGRIEWVNDGFVRITGYTLAEAAGRRPGSFLQGPATDPEAVRRMRARLAAGVGFAEEVVNYGKSGREYWVAVDVQPIRDEAGVLTNFIAIESEVTARKRSEEALRNAHDELRQAHIELESRVRARTAELAAKAESLRRAEEDYRGIFENAVEGIYQTTPEGRYLRANPALAVMFGYATPGELLAELGDVGRQLYVDPGRREEFRRLVDGRGSVTDFESRVRRRDGRVIWISENARAVRGGAGAVACYEGTVSDVTGRRQAEAEIRALHGELEAAYDATIEGWAKALDLRDKETEGHTRRVTEMSLRLASALGLEGEALVHIRRGALLHDIGKLGVPDAVLLKAGPLTEQEWEVMRRHPGNARDWLESIPVLRPALEIPYGHHEKWDGSGYPRGLAGESIPLAARLFAAVDIWDALRSDRPYRAAWPEDRVRAHLESLAGSHLDPAVVASFLRVLDGEAAGVTVGPAAVTGTGTRAGGFAAKRKRRLVRRRELERDLERLTELAATDDLTGLKNRRHFREALQAGFDAAVRRDRPLSLVLLDLDGFKSYNDAHGHPAGDEVLRATAALLRSQAGGREVVARHGGEEFAVLLPGVAAAEGRAWAERLRSAMAGYRWPRSPVTASFGLSTLTPDVPGPEELVERADRAMYMAKRLGRNRVAHHQDLSPAIPGGQTLRSMGPDLGFLTDRPRLC